MISATGAVQPGAALLASRDPLLALRNGYAAAVVGGSGGPTVVVTTAADSGAGSLRSYLEDPNPQWIRFDPSLANTTINLAAVCNAYGNKTIDGRGVPGVTIKNATGLVWTGRQNIIVAYVTIAADSTSASVDGATFDNCDLIWLHHVSGTAARDGIVDVTGWQTGTTFGQCRATFDWCRFGPHPNAVEAAAHGIAVGGKTNLLGSPTLSPPDDPAKGLFTLHHCLWEGSRQRGPFIDSAFGHLYNCANRKWGDPNGGGYAVEVGPSPATGGVSQALIENCVFDPYTIGEAHLVSGTVVNPDLEAVIRRDDTYPLIKTSGLLLLGGAQTGLSVIGPSVNGTTTHLVNPVESFNDAVFTPSYTYGLETADSALLAKLRAGAGNIQT